MSLLKIENALVTFRQGSRVINAVDGVSLTAQKGEILAVVGESGCGKTTLARAILGLQPLSGGSIELNGVKVQGVRRGQAEQIGMIWQDPYASLDPRYTIRDILSEPLHLAGKSKDIGQLLVDIGMNEELADRYPHQLSGGQRQRVAIGRALALRPPLVICDEPTAALDLSMQAQILNLLRDLQKSLGCTFLYISHDLATVQFLADRVAVMYMGKIVEIGTSHAVFESPKHPYTRGLLASAPKIESLGKLPPAIEGEISGEVPSGCRFSNRCPFVQERCCNTEPEFQEFPNQSVACFYPQN